MIHCVRIGIVELLVVDKGRANTLVVHAPPAHKQDSREMWLYSHAPGQLLQDFLAYCYTNVCKPSCLFGMLLDRGSYRLTSPPPLRQRFLGLFVAYCETLRLSCPIV